MGGTSPDAEGDALGRRVSAAGDVDGDGRADFWVTAPGVESGAVDGGRAYLVLGRPDLDGIVGFISDHAVATIDGSTAATELGRSIMSNQDIDGDGAVDVLVGHAGGEAGEGGVLIFLGDTWEGTTTEADADHRITGELDDDALGASLAVLDGFFTTPGAVVAVGSGVADHDADVDAGVVSLFGPTAFAAP